jgi:hypothetical protein
MLQCKIKGVLPMRTYIQTLKLSVVSAAVLSTAAPALASTGYQLTPETGFEKSEKIIVRETLWKCAGDSCTASEAASRPEIVCATAARKIGRISAFTAKGVAFDAAALNKCNTRANAKIARAAKAKATNATAN